MKKQMRSVATYLYKNLRYGWQVPLAGKWRFLLARTEIVAVTGSGGKSTSVALISRILSKAGKTHIGIFFNADFGIANAMLGARPWHRYYVQEVSGHFKGAMEIAATLLRPTVAVVTTVGSDHWANFRSRDAIAAEKGILVQRLSRDSVAVLNADDSLVLGMGEKTRAKVVTFGLSEKAMIRGRIVSGGYPDRLCLDVQYQDQTLRIRSRFIGHRWVTPLLASVACALAIGIDRETLISVIEKCEPLFMRDSVHTIKNGPVFILDCEKASIWTLPSSFHTVHEAKAERKTIILGTLSDYNGARKTKYKKAADQALEVCDRLIMVGPDARVVSTLRERYPEKLIYIFDSTELAAEFIKDTSVDNELIYVKGSRGDHLERIMLNADSPISCWREHCGKQTNCTGCRELRSASVH